MTISNTGRSSRFHEHPHRDHPVHGRVTVLGRTVNKLDEWTVKNRDGVLWSIPEQVLLELPVVP